MEFKGTKGSWGDMGGDNTSIDIVLDNGSTISINRYDRYCPGVLACTREEMEANAKLISKAPEMLKMLRNLLYDLSHIENKSPAIWNRIANVEDLIEEATTI